MIRSRTLGTIVSSIALMLVASACNDTRLPVAPQVNRSVVPADLPHRMGLDAKFSEIASRVPGFGGAFYDSVGNLTIRLTDVSTRDVALAVIAPLLDADIAHMGAISVRAGRYGFLQLAGWRERLSPSVLSIPGVVFTDADELRNRVTVGISDPVPAA